MFCASPSTQVKRDELEKHPSRAQCAPSETAGPNRLLGTTQELQRTQCTADKLLWAQSESVGTLGLTRTLTSLKPRMSVFPGQDDSYREDKLRGRLKPMCLLTRRTTGRLMRLLRREFTDCTPWGQRREKTAGEECILNVTVMLSNIHSRSL